MSRFSGFRTRLHRAIHRRAMDQQLIDEMKDHVERETARRIAAGEDPVAARRHAEIEFGHVGSYEEQVRDRRLGRAMGDFVQAVQFATRRLRRTPVFSLTALGTLALCIGANVTILAVVDAIVLRPMPFPEPDRLVTVINSYPGAGYPHGGPSFANFHARREAIDAFSAVAMINDKVGARVGEPGSQREVPMALVSAGFFSTLGAPLAMGREFTEDEMEYASAQVAVLTDHFWRSDFGADPDVIGKAFHNDAGWVTVVGVLPPGFHYLSTRADFFRPLASSAAERSIANRHNTRPNTSMVARLAPDATLAQAQAQLDALDAHQAEIDPQKAFLKEWGYHAIVRPLHADYIREIRPTLLLLQGGVLFLLLIGTVNLVNLLLVRALGRRRELAVRHALGARSFHFLRDAVIETSILAAGGGGLGLAVGYVGVSLLYSLGASRLPLGANIALDGRVVVGSVVGTLILGVLLAVHMIWIMRQQQLPSRLRSETGNATVSPLVSRMRQVFSVGQIALAFIVLSGAALLGMSLRRIMESPTGFTPDHVLTVKISLPWDTYPARAHHVQFAERIEREFAGQPGLSEVAINNSMPFSGYTAGGPVTVEDQAQTAGTSVRAHHRAGVVGDYWRVMGIPLLSGRKLEPADSVGDAPRVCVVDQAFADTYWPGQDPVGKRITFASTFDPDNAATIVGVVGSTKQTNLTETESMGMVYYPFSRFNSTWFFILLRTSIEPAAMARSVRAVMHRLDPNLVISEIEPMQDYLDENLVPQRSPAILAAIFAGVALLLCCVGTYGVLAFTVSQRRREIGVRLALGALPRQILQLFLRLGGRLLLIGCVLGVLGAWATGRAMQSFLFEVAPFSPAILLGVTALQGLVVMIAVIIPAFRAASVHPNETLRHE